MCRTTLPICAIAEIALLALTGCTASMKAIEHPGQTVMQRGRAAQTEREGIAVVVRPVEVPPIDEGAMTAVAVEVVNQSDRSARLAVESVVLVGGDGMRRSAMDPRRFARYAREVTEGPPPYVYRPYRVVVGVGYGGWHYPGPPYYYGYDPFWYDSYDAYDAYQDYYRRREQTARFIAMLWKTGTVEPGYAGGGVIVFPYKLRKKEMLCVEVTIDRPASTRPASRPTTRTLEPTTTGPLKLTFFFKT